MDRYERLGLHVIAKERDLHRPFRFAADGLLRQEQCEEILALMEVSVRCPAGCGVVDMLGFFCAFPSYISGVHHFLVRFLRI